MQSATSSEEFPVIARIGRSGFATEIAAGDHLLRADEPVVAGGTATGPTPYDYLLAALGTCTAMTLRTYADRKGWPLEGVVVRLRHSRIYAQDCADCETRDGKVDVIDRRIELQGALDAAQRENLLRIADRCPVHRTLSAEIKVRTEAAG
jgi:putative redox protein